MGPTVTTASIHVQLLVSTDALVSTMDGCAIQEPPRWYIVVTPSAITMNYYMFEQGLEANHHHHCFW